MKRFGDNEKYYDHHFTENYGVDCFLNSDQLNEDFIIHTYSPKVKINILKTSK